MAVSYPLTLPTTKSPRRISFLADNAVGLSRSPFTFASQTVEHQGGMWVAEITYPNMLREHAAELQGFLLALNGRRGTFLLGDILGAAPQGIATGTPVVNGGSQTGKTLLTSGWSNSITNILKAGDYIQLGSGGSSRLYMVVQNANSNGSGQATLEIWPRIRESPSNGATVTLTNTKGLFRLIENSVSVTVASGPSASAIYSISFGAIEAV